MTDLMAKRYKVNIKYPFCPWRLGEIISGGKLPLWDVKDFPEIFQPLEWWQERDKKELPKYVKDEKGVYKVKEWHTELAPKCTVYINPKIHTGYMDYTRECPLYSEMLPATKEEYDNYLKTAKP